MVYDVKTVMFGWNKLNDRQDDLINESKNLICINCWLSGELNEDNNMHHIKNLTNDNNEEINNPENIDYNNNNGNNDQFNHSKNNSDN